mmetsp:Transcript_25458/g.71005  ORF Transcript_25458/g.71005 Transcript_25458/m.71005 type:complete len:535 (+) Transcript_25458:106-1710(+)
MAQELPAKERDAPKQVAVSADAADKIVEMGMCESREHAERALRQARGIVEEAVRLLLRGEVLADPCVVQHNGSREAPPDAAKSSGARPHPAFEQKAAAPAPPDATKSSRARPADALSGSLTAGVDQLMEMRMAASQEEAEAAIRQANGNVHCAVRMLLRREAAVTRERAAQAGSNAAGLAAVAPAPDVAPEPGVDAIMDMGGLATSRGQARAALRRGGSVERAVQLLLRGEVPDEDDVPVASLVMEKMRELKRTGAMKTPTQQASVIDMLANSIGMIPEALTAMWNSIVDGAPTAEPGASVEQRGPESWAYVDQAYAIYKELAERHHGVQVSVRDLGGCSARHLNSCMFLTCAASIVHLRLDEGCEACWGDGGMRFALEEVAELDGSQTVETLIASHKRRKNGTLGRMADVLRQAACEVLEKDEDVFFPFFHPQAVREPADGGLAHAEVKTDSSLAQYRTWVRNLRGSMEGDSLVVLALARLCNITVQPVQMRGYLVPRMDPPGGGNPGTIVYWGNDDYHWVWLKPMVPPALPQ